LLKYKLSIINIFEKHIHAYIYDNEFRLKYWKICNRNFPLQYWHFKCN